MSVIIYGSATCVPCKSTKKYLDKKNFEYDYVDVTANTDALEAINRLGYTGIPVVYVDEFDHWSGYNLERLDELVNREG